MCNDKKTTSSSTSNQTETSSPVNPGFVTQGFTDYGNDVNDFLTSQGSPTSSTFGSQYVAPASTLQNQAFTGASNLGSGLSDLSDAAKAVSSLTGQSTPTVTGAGYGAAQVADPTAAPAQGYTPTSMTGATVGAVDPITGAKLASVGDISGSTIDTGDIQRLLNPYLGQVVDATGADMDHDAQVAQAAQRATAGLTGAFGSSGFGIANAELTADQARSKATVLGNLRSSGYDTAEGYANDDADRKQAAAVANQNKALALSEAQGQLDEATQTQNQNTAQSRALAQAGYDETTGQSNQAAGNAASAFDATSANSLNELLAQLRTQTGEANAGADNTASEFGAAAGNTAQLANQSATMQTAQQRLAAAMGLGDIGTATDADATGIANTQAAMGATQRGITSDQLAAPLNMLSVLQSLEQYNPALLQGKTGTASGTTSSTSTTTPGLLDDFATLSSALGNLGSAATGSKGGGFQSLFNGGG